MSDETSLPSFDSLLRDRPQLFTGKWTLSAPNAGTYLHDPLRTLEHMPTVALLQSGMSFDEKAVSIEFSGYPLHFIDEAVSTIPSRLQNLISRTASLELWMPKPRETKRVIPTRSPDLTFDRLWPFLGAASEEASSETNQEDLDPEASFESEELQKTVVSLLYAMGAERVYEPSSMVMDDGYPSEAIFATFPEFHANVSALAFPMGYPVGAHEISAAVDCAQAKSVAGSVTYPWIVVADTVPKEVLQIAAYARLMITDLRGLMMLTVRYGIEHARDLQ